MTPCFGVHQNTCDENCDDENFFENGDMEIAFFAWQATMAGLSSEGRGFVKIFFP